MVAYNHGAYLAQAIESVLEQDYASWELVIGDDCSSDDTLELARKYAAEHPEKIRVLETEVNLGGRRNYLRTLSACRGEFIAQLDGDDYWTSTDKLRVSVDFLDREPGCAMVFSACRQVSGAESRTTSVFRPPGRRARYSQQDLIWGNIAASASVLWRRPDFEGLPGWFMEVPVGDWPLHTLVAEGGWIGYIDRIMCAHRVHEGGVWGGLGAVAQLQRKMEVRRYLREHLGDRVGEIARAADLRDRFRIAKALAAEGERARAADGFLWCFRNRIKGRKPHPVRSLLSYLRCRYL